MGWTPFNMSDGLTPIQVEKLNSNFSNINQDLQSLYSITGRQINPIDAYPLGSIYTTANDEDPAGVFGGTWVEISNVDGIHMWKRVV